MKSIFHYHWFIRETTQARNAISLLSFAFANFVPFADQSILYMLEVTHKFCSKRLNFSLDWQLYMPIAGIAVIEHRQIQVRT